MTTHVAHKLIGYDNHSEKLAVACDVPRDAVTQVKCIAGIVVPDSQVADWELTAKQSQEFARLIGASWDAARYDCFLEPYALNDQTAS